MQRSLNFLKSPTSIWLVVAIAFVIRLSYSFFQYSNDVMSSFADDLAYKHFGEQVVLQGPLVMDLDCLGSYAGVVGPGIGWVTGLIIVIFGSSWLPLFILNSILGALSCLILYRIGVKFITTHKIALSAAFYLAFYIPLLRYTSTSGKEIWMSFLFLLIFYSFLKGLNSGRLSFNLIISAILFALLVHFDERFLIFAPFIVLAILWWPGLGSLYNKLKISSIITGIVLVLMSPWLIRNYMVYERVIIVSVRTNFITEKLFGYEPKNYLQESDKSRWYLSANRIDSVTGGYANTYDGGLIIHDKHIEALKRGHFPREFSKLKTMLVSFVRYWQPFIFRGIYTQDGYRYVIWSPIHNLIKILFFSWMLLILPVGLYYLLKTDKNLFLIIISILLIHSLLHALFVPFSEDRYRIPLDPLIILTVFYGLSRLLKNRNGVSNSLGFRSK